MELGKLILRSDEKSSSLVEGALKFIGLNPHSFHEIEILTQKLQSPNDWETFYPLLYAQTASKIEEPCYLAFSPIFHNDPKDCMGFLTHIFKGEQDISPLPIKEIVIGAKQYHRLVYTLKHDLKRLNRAPDIETWLHLLERYTKWIPASHTLPQVSLYQYIRLKMALASCIKEENIEASPLALFAVKITGKTKFLCSVEPGNDLSGFKGGAYYFQMLRENLIEDFLKAVDLPLCNLLFQEHDRFILLVEQSQKEKLSQKIVANEEFLCQQHHGMLSLSAHFNPISFSDIKEKGLPMLFQHIFSILEKKAKQPFLSLLDDSFHKHALIFGPWEKNPEHTENFSTSLQWLGQELGKARWVQREEYAEPMFKATMPWENMPKHFGKKEILLSKNPEKSTTLYRFSNTDFFSCAGKGFIFSDIVPYLMAEESIPEIQYWCFVHFQVDTFHEVKLTNTFFTVKEYLQDFFRTYLLALLREKKYRKYTYAAYMEAPFFTLVCSPQIALCLVNQIHKKFRQFTEGTYTLSAKMSLFNAEYPFQKAFYQEHQNFASQENLHNKIILADEILPWSFLDHLQKAQEKISSIVKGKGKHFLFPLWGLSEFFQKRKKTKKNLTLWKHLVHYHFNRLGLGDCLEKHLLESEKGPLYLNLALEWNALMSLEA